MVQSVAHDIKTGGVLVFVSRPGFDPNPFVVGIANDAYQALQHLKISAL